MDRYDSGDLIIDGKSTKGFKDKDWDAYRNHAVGFIFQSYNLISHISVLENVEMGMTLSGVSSAERRRKALELLEKVGLKDHAHKRPNQLSGGQMQRVAIARALANNPKIILADEPTGALDSKTSTQIMELIKEIAKDKLVIMVTHNAELAKDYASRIVSMKDGVILDDTDSYDDENKRSGELSIKKTSMSLLSALKLSFNNIKTKKGRTALTAFASSIGIIGIALILSLSNGFNKEVEEFEENSLAQSPIIIANESVQMDEDTLKALNRDSDLEEYTDKDTVYTQDDLSETLIHQNNITEDYVNYLEKMNKDDVAGISYMKGTNIQLIEKSDGYNLVSIGSGGSVSTGMSMLPVGNIVILQVDSKNRVSTRILRALGFDDEETSFNDILNKEFKIPVNDEYYQKQGNYFIPVTNLEKVYNSDNSITVKIKAIIRGKEDKKVVTDTSTLYYNDEVISKNKDSEIVKAQKDADFNVLIHQAFDENTTKENMLGYLGGDTLPVAIYIYPKDFETKDNITNYLDDYNKGKDESDIIQYTDMAGMISSLSGNIMDAITIVLIAFSSISLIVSSIMIGIITYISVLERTKEIGILRSLGARKKDIKRVFNAETFIIGIFSGLLGVGIAYALTFPVNIIIENLSGLAGVAKLNPVHALILILVSLTLTIIGGAIPANMASKKDPVIALRTE